MFRKSNVELFEGKVGRTVMTVIDHKVNGI